MTIAALPESAARILGSAQVLTNPVSLVKELIDNALDAKASSIDVTIDSSTIRKIEVRDNGTGIAVEDLGVLGKHGHTSKLRSLDELRIIGSTSLGFRGEALASAVELGEVNVTTKTEGQSVATTASLQPKGGVASRKPTSHPVGTTICVSNFLEKLVVRKKRALVDSIKTLSSIKELLQAYALARLTVRFSLKVVQVDVKTTAMRKGRGDWAFVPKATRSIKEAVTQVIGKDIAAECLESSMTFPLGKKSEESDGHSVKIEAFLAKPDADLSKISKGQFLSIDSRPLACSRGTMKKIVALYKIYLRSAISRTNNFATQIKNPFLRLNIVCKPGIYDPNVEPAKDDILFENEVYLLECIEKLFTAVYGELKFETPGSKVLVQENKGFEVLLARRPDMTSLKDKQHTAKEHIENERPTESSMDELSGVGNNEESLERDFETLPVQKGHSWGFSMVRDYDEAPRAAATSQPRPDLPSSEVVMNEDERNDQNSLNPWVIAKLNASTRDESTMIPQLTGLRQTVDQDLPPLIPRDEPTLLATPHHSSESALAAGAGKSRARIRDPSESFITARDVPLDRPWSPPPTLEPRPKRQRGYNKPFNQPFKDNNSAERTPEPTRQQIITFDDNLPRTRFSLPISPSAQTSLSNNHQQSLHQTTLDEDLQSSLAFEHRKEEATRARRLENRAAHKAALAVAQQASSAPRSSPHQNRYNAATAALDNTGQSANESGVTGKEKEVVQTSLRDGDPRAYLMRRHRSMQMQDCLGSVVKVKRAKSSLLPLETVPKRQMIQNLELEVGIEGEDITRMMIIMSKTDGYTRKGAQEKGLSIAAEEVEDVAKKLESVVGLWKRRTFGDMELETELDLAGLRCGSLPRF